MWTLSRYLRFPPSPGAAALGGERALFLSRTYSHLLGAVAAFVLVEVLLLRSGAAAFLARAGLFESWLTLLGASMIAGWLATSLAGRARSLGAQYAGLALYVLLQALIFVPLFWSALAHDPRALVVSAVTVLLAVGALTAIAFQSRMDFRYLGALLR